MDDRDRHAAEAPAYNLMKQKMGAKGSATRQHILDTASRLVDMQTGESPSISTICREAAISKATFYQYFEDFRTLILELLKPAATDVEVLAGTIATPCPEAEIFDQFYAFVSAYFTYCTRHRVAFRLRNLAADAGDEEMILSRLRAGDAIARQLAARVCAARQGTRERRDDHALAIALMHAMSSAAMFLT